MEKMISPTGIDKIICFSGTIPNGEKKEISNTIPLMLKKIESILNMNSESVYQCPREITSQLYYPEHRMKSITLAVTLLFWTYSPQMDEIIHSFIQQVLMDVHHVSGILSGTGIQE